eukprot:748795-Hanusia_phi.AAC.2
MDPAQETPSQAEPVDPKIKKQIEFYFCDSNLPKDRFLLSKTKETPEGWVSLELIASFKKMRELGATTSKLAVAAAASDFLEVDQEATRVRRTTPLPETDVTIPRSLHAKEFPGDTSIEQLESFFSGYGTVLSVRLLKSDKKETESAPISAFIEFSTKEEAEAVISKEITFANAKLEMVSKEEYLKQNPSASSENEKGKDGKKKGHDGKGGDKKDKSEKKEDSYKAYPKGIFIKIEGIGEGATMHDIKDTFSKYGSVKFVEFKEGETVACIRFDTPDDASEAVRGEKNAGTEICGSAITVSAITGEEEDQKLEEIKQKQVDNENANIPTKAVKSVFVVTYYCFQVDKMNRFGDKVLFISSRFILSFARFREVEAVEAVG